MVDEDDKKFEPAKKIYDQKIIYVFKDGYSLLEINKSYWPRYKYDITEKIKKHLKEGFTSRGRRYTAEDLETVTIIYPE